VRFISVYGSCDGRVEQARHASESTPALQKRGSGICKNSDGCGLALRLIVRMENSRIVKSTINHSRSSSFGNTRNSCKFRYGGYATTGSTQRNTLSSLKCVRCSWGQQLQSPSQPHMLSDGLLLSTVLWTKRELGSWTAPLSLTIQARSASERVLYAQTHSPALRACVLADRRQSGAVQVGLTPDRRRPSCLQCATRSRTVGRVGNAAVSTGLMVGWE